MSREHAEALTPPDLWHELQAVIEDMRAGKTVPEVSIATLRRVQAAIAGAPAGEQPAELTDEQRLLQFAAWCIRRMREGKA